MSENKTERTWTDEEMVSGFEETPQESNFVDGEGYVTASDGKPIFFSNKVPGTKDGKYGHPIPVMSRDVDRAGQTIYAGDYRLTYDENGYCEARAKVSRNR